MKLEFSRHILKNTQLPNFMKMRHVGAGVLHADGRTGRRTDRHDETKERFSQFCERF